ncbi:MAG: DUF952 domain-containing protein, partial [Chloroflexota bacterium]|nr:DUF952 domain-containing protein [Chloroflexota bacterium]
MREDLVFHLVKKNVWEEKKSNSRYHPESIDSQGFIECISGKDIEPVVNNKFKGEKGILLIVINTALIEPKLKYEEDSESKVTRPRIYGPLNLDAVIDKIELAPEEDGSFQIS